MSQIADVSLHSIGDLASTQRLSGAGDLEVAK